MIYSTPLTKEQMARSQRNVCYYTAINGVSYMCLGDTVVSLLAVRLGMPDWVVSALGAMIYFGYALLPLGKRICSRVGAAKTQSYCWVARNIVALLVASCVIWHQLDPVGNRVLNIVCILLGSFLFYGFRSAGVVMSVPLIGNITDESSRSKLLGFSNGLFYLTASVSLVVINLLMWRYDSIWMLFASILFGSLCGFTASHFLARIDETDAVKKHASTPFFRDLKEIVRNDAIRRMVFARSALNLCAMMTLTMYVLPLKRGYGVPDSLALLFTLIVYIGKSITGLTFAPIIKWLGAKRALMTCCLLYASAAPLWIIAPNDYHFVYVLIICIILGASDAVSENGKGLYLLQCVPERLQTSVSVLVSLVDGALMGLFAIALNAILLKASERMNWPFGADSPMDKYRLYNLLALPFLTLAFWCVARLKNTGNK